MPHHPAPAVADETEIDLQKTAVRQVLPLPLGRLVLDMSAVPFVDSAGLGALIGGIRRARESGGDVAVCCNRPTLVRLLHTTGFDRIVTVTETIEEAAAFLGDDNEVAPA